jgi:hypothetical protein
MVLTDRPNHIPIVGPFYLHIALEGYSPSFGIVYSLKQTRSRLLVAHLQETA